MTTDKALIGRRSQLFRRLLKYRDILPGSLVFRTARCGKSNCICHRDPGRLHTFYQYHYKIAGEKAVTKSIPKQHAPQVQRQVRSNKEFKKIMREIHKINLEILFDHMEKEKLKNKKKEKKS